jgi:hypothetical protein
MVSLPLFVEYAGMSLVPGVDGLPMRGLFPPWICQTLCIFTRCKMLKAALAERAEGQSTPGMVRTECVYFLALKFVR